MGKKIFVCVTVFVFANAISSTPDLQVIGAQDVTSAKSQIFPIDSSGIGAPSLEKFLAKAYELKKLFERDANGNFIDNSKEARLGRWALEMSLRYGWF